MSTEKLQNANTPLRTPPEGFVWKLYGDATFLKPRVWHERERAAATRVSARARVIATATYATSPERFGETKPFEMGLTVQVIRDSRKLFGIEAKQIARAYLIPFLNAHKEKDTLFFDHDTQGDFDHAFFRYRDAPPGGKPIIVHKFMLANNITDSVHVFTFESPAQTWDENWARYGTPILSQTGVTTVISVPLAQNNVQ